MMEIRKMVKEKRESECEEEEEEEEAIGQYVLNDHLSKQP